MADPPHDLGLALSGGGSRAAGFHRGTLLALDELSLTQKVDVVSTVSGGSVFGGAWLAALADGVSNPDFLATMRDELAKGFILRSVRPKLGLAFMPGIDYTRTHLIADTFDRVFFKGKTLADLPVKPALCINTAVLNNGQVAKFARGGFSAWGLSFPGSTPSHLVPWTGFPLSLAVAASAAFPIGLPPVELRRRRFPSGTVFGGDFEKARGISLTDGGVLENLGIQSLLQSRRFAAWNLIVSDAGTAEDTWQSRPVIGALRGFGVWVASGRILDRLMSVMNSKQNRWARQQVVEEMQASWMAAALGSGAPAPDPALASYLEGLPTRPRRGLIFVRINQTLPSFLRSLPHHRLVELAVANGNLPSEAPTTRDPALRRNFLENVNVDFKHVDRHYEALGGDAGALAMNEVATNFTALEESVLDKLAAHAAWQVHAGHAIYGI
jgi:predicted acylesterase/phospholipase RssA